MGIEAHEINPGDKILVKLDRVSPDDTLEYIKQHVQAWAGTGVDILVIQPGISVEIIKGQTVMK